MLHFRVGYTDVNIQVTRNYPISSIPLLIFLMVVNLLILLHPLPMKTPNILPKFLTPGLDLSSGPNVSNVSNSPIQHFTASPLPSVPLQPRALICIRLCPIMGKHQSSLLYVSYSEQITLCAHQNLNTTIINTCPDLFIFLQLYYFKTLF